MRSIFFAAVALHLVKAVADNEFCLFVVAQIHQIIFDLVWIILVDICHPSIGAALQAQRLEMGLELFETETCRNNDVLAVVKAIYSDSTKNRKIQSIDLGCIGSLCSAKDWKRGSCINGEDLNLAMQPLTE